MRSPPAGVAPGAARAQRVQLLPPQRRRRAARVVVPPVGLPRLVPGRARHAHATRSSGRRCRRTRPAPPTRRHGGVQGPGRGHGHVTRLPAQPGERIDRARAIGFTFDGKAIPGVRGRHDRVRAVRVRAAHVQPLVQVPPPARRAVRLRPVRELARADRRPPRACARAPSPSTDGLAVTHTNARPGLDFDVMRATDVVGGPFTPPGFYYKTFIRPRRLWPLYEKVLRSRRRPRRAAQAPGRPRAGAPSTAAATATCS